MTSLLHTSGDTQEALGDFLDSVRSAFRAGMAELVLLGPAGREGATVSRSLIYSLLKQGKLEAVRIGCRGKGKWLIEQTGRRGGPAIAGAASKEA